MAGNYRREERLFRVWSFAVSHNQLILRSEPTAIERTTTRAEIYFGNVQIMFIRPIYRGVHVRKMSVSERSEAVERFGLDVGLDGGFYRLESYSLDFVVSSTPSWREAERPFDDPSLFDFSQPWPQNDVTEGTIE